MTPPLADVSFRGSWPAAVVFLLAAGAVLYVGVLYARERSLSPARRAFLAGLRGTVCVLLLLLLLEPVSAVTETTTLPAEVIVLVDTSASMAVADPRRRPEDLREAALALQRPGPTAEEVQAVPRLELARGILRHPAWQALREKNPPCRLRYVSFADRVEAGPEGPEEVRAWADGLRAGGPETRLGEALREALARQGGRPTAGVVLLTDGGSNAGEDPEEIARRAGVPLFPVGLGLPEPDDVRLGAVLVAEAVFPGDRAPVRVEVHSSPSFADHPAALVLRIDGEEVDRKEIALRGAGQLEELTFLPAAGEAVRQLEVGIEPLPGEVSEQNNQAARAVRVIDRKIRVLYVEGRPRWEFRYLRAVLRRDPRLEVKFLLTEGDPDLPAASPEYLARFPDQEADAFRHDLVILGDVPAAHFTAEQLDWLERLVRERGGSFLLLAGERHAPMTYLDTPVAKLLPVRLAPGGNDPVAPSAHPLPTPEGLRSGVLALGVDEEDTRAAWSLARPLYEVPRLAGAKPGAVVLATLSEPADPPYPLIAWHRYGTGKVLHVGTGQLWRLRYRRGDEYHAAFWGQAIRFLTLSRLLGANQRVRIEVGPGPYRAGEEVPIHAHVLDETYQPVTAESYTLFVEDAAAPGEARAVLLRPTPDVPGLYRGSLTSRRPGTFRLKPPPEDAGDASPAAFEVTEADLESRDPALKEESLRRIAELSGGKYLSAADLDSLPGLLPDKARRVLLPPRDRTLWDHWLVLLAAVGCAGLEWFLRRNWDLA